MNRVYSDYDNMTNNTKNPILKGIFTSFVKDEIRQLMENFYLGIDGGLQKKKSCQIPI